MGGISSHAIHGLADERGSGNDKTIERTLLQRNSALFRTSL